MTHLIPDSQAEGGLDLEDHDGLGERFWESFSAFVEDKKRQAVLDVLKEEFPKLAQNPQFVENVAARLSDSAIDELPYVFLVTNPKLSS